MRGGSARPRCGPGFTRCACRAQGLGPSGNDPSRKSSEGAEAAAARSIAAGRMSSKARSSKPRDFMSALQLARALNRYVNMNAAGGYVLAPTELPLAVARLVVDIL